MTTSNQIDDVIKYTNKYVKNYFFSDAQSIIDNIKIKNQGNCTYLLIMGTLSCMERCGALVYQNSTGVYENFSPGKGNAYMQYYWDEYLCQTDSIYNGYSELARLGLRHSLMHSFTGRGLIGATRGNLHMQRNIQNVDLVICADQLFADFKKSYLNIYLKDLKNNQQIQTVSISRYNEIKQHDIDIMNRVRQSLPTI